MRTLRTRGQYRCGAHEGKYSDKRTVTWRGRQKNLINLRQEFIDRVVERRPFYEGSMKGKREESYTYWVLRVLLGGQG